MEVYLGNNPKFEDWLRLVVDRAKGLAEEWSEDYLIYNDFDLRIEFINPTMVLYIEDDEDEIETQCPIYLIHFIYTGEDKTYLEPFPVALGIDESTIKNIYNTYFFNKKMTLPFSIHQAASLIDKKCHEFMERNFRK